MFPNQGAPQAPQAQGQDAGLDVNAQIEQGIIAFAQSQDPAIAVEVVTMLAQVMGIQPDVQPYAQGANPAQPAQSNIPMYKRGGKIQSYASIDFGFGDLD